MENAQIAVVVDAISDVVKEIANIMFKKDEERKVQPLSQFSTVCVCVCVRMHASMCTCTNTSVGIDMCVHCEHACLFHPPFTHVNITS